MTITARTPERLDVSSLRRGFDEVCILLNKEENVLPPEQLVFAYRNRRDQLELQRKKAYVSLGSPNRNNLNKWKGREQKCRAVSNTELLKLYFEIGEKIWLIQTEIKKINSLTRQGIPLSFGRIFIGVSREVLPEEIYKRIHEKSQELEQQGFMGTSEEWAEFVSSLS